MREASTDLATVEIERTSCAIPPARVSTMKHNRCRSSLNITLWSKMRTKNSNHQRNSDPNLNNEGRFNQSIKGEVASYNCTNGSEFCIAITNDLADEPAVLQHGV